MELLPDRALQDEIKAQISILKTETSHLPLYHLKALLSQQIL